MNTPVIDVSWNECALALDIPARTETLPFTLDCPFCKTAKSLTIFQNTTHNTGWHHCKACSKSGDLIEFCSSFLGMSIESTFVELAKRGVMSLITIKPKMIDLYDQYYLKQRVKGRNGWAHCAAYFKKPTKAVNELLISFNLQLKKWENFNPRPERYVGATHVRDLERELGTQFTHRAVVDGKVIEDIDTLPLRFPSGWSDVLVLPFESAPGALIGFLCIGYRHGKIQRRFTRVRLTNNTFNAKLPACDAGIWGLHTSTYGKSTYGDYVVALEDPLLALRIQSRHALMSNTPLPIVSWLFTEGEATQFVSWSAVTQKNIIIVTPKLTPSAIHAAYTSGGWLAVLDMSEESVQELIKNKKPEDLMRNFIRRALPWRDAIRRWISMVSENMVKALFNSLSLHCKEADVIASEFYDDIQPTESRSVKCVRVCLRNKVTLLVENATGWFARIGVTDYAQITNFTVKLKSIQVRGSVKAAQGTIFFKGTEIPIVLNKKEITDPQAFESHIVNKCLESGLGYPNINTAGINLLRLTRLFAEPQVYKFPCSESDLVPVN